MRHHIILLAFVLALSALPEIASAHFGMIIPSQSMVMPPERSVDLVLSFSHPFEGVGMELEKPEHFGLASADGKADLLPALKQTTVMGSKGWKATHTFSRPGVASFYMVPKPYWEPAEDCYIVHMTKTVVAAFGDEHGWAEPVGLETEIVPLTRPFGNYAGNVFQGRVLVNGKPVPHAEVEVEYYNEDGALSAPSDYMITQVVRADADGVFTYACPRAGWWGFAALNEADRTIAGPDGTRKAVELGAVIWVEFKDFQTK